MAELNFPADLKFAKSDEWVRIEGDTATIGISDFAQDQLNDIVYAEYTVNVGDAVASGDSIASIESVKAASDVYTFVAGTITAVNDGVASSPETINSDAYGAGWLVKIKLDGEPDLSGLMDAEAYKEFCKDR